jgi:hypothetical protein
MKDKPHETTPVEAIQLAVTMLGFAIFFVKALTGRR